MKATRFVLSLSIMFLLIGSAVAEEGLIGQWIFSQDNVKDQTIQGQVGELDAQVEATITIEPAGESSVGCVGDIVDAMFID